MRRSFVLALTALMLVFALTACGSRNNDTVQNPPTTENSTAGTTQSGTTGGTNSNTTQDDHRPNGNTNDSLLDDAGNAVGDVVDGVENAVDDVLPGDNANTQQRSTGGVPYGDMMNRDR